MTDTKNSSTKDGGNGSEKPLTKNDERYPETYSPNLPRVSQIVSWAYPFDRTEFFVDWLAKYGVSYDDYMEEACGGGRRVHSAIEEYVEKGGYSETEYVNRIESAISFIKDKDVKFESCETYVVCEDYQGTADAVALIGGKRWVLDWKTYGLAKDKFGIPQGKYRKPSSKLKKASLQLTLYARLLDAEKIGIVELTEDGYVFHELEKVPEETVRLILKEFSNDYVDMI